MQVYCKLGDLHYSVSDLEAIIRIEPNHTSAVRELDHVKRLVQKENAKCAPTYRRMFASSHNTTAACSGLANGKAKENREPTFVLASEEARRLQEMQVSDSSEGEWAEATERPQVAPSLKKSRVANMEVEGPAAPPTMLQEAEAACEELHRTNDAQVVRDFMDCDESAIPAPDSYEGFLAQNS